MTTAPARNRRRSHTHQEQFRVVDGCEPWEFWRRLEAAAQLDAYLVEGRLEEALATYGIGKLCDRAEAIALASIGGRRLYE